MKTLHSFTAMSLLAASVAFGQSGATLPEGTKIRLRLEQPLSSGTAQVNQPVTLTVVDEVTVDGTVVIPQGSSALGSVTMVEPKGHMGRKGKLDFTVERVRAADGKFVPLRYAPEQFAGKGSTVSTGLITAGIAVVFWPAAPIALLRKGHDINIPQGAVFQVFTDSAFQLGKGNGNAAAPVAGTAPATGTGRVEIVGEDNADVQIGGAFAGSVPARLNVAAGTHNFEARLGSQKWSRTVDVSAGSQITFRPIFEQPAATTATAKAR